MGRIFGLSLLLESNTRKCTKWFLFPGESQSSSDSYVCEPWSHSQDLTKLHRHFSNHLWKFSLGESLRLTTDILRSSQNNLGLSLSSMSGPLPPPTPRVPTQPGEITDSKMQKQSWLWHHWGQASLQGGVNDTLLLSLSEGWEKSLPSCCELLWSLYFWRQHGLWRQGSWKHLPTVTRHFWMQWSQKVISSRPPWGSGLILWTINLTTPPPPP